MARKLRLEYPGAIYHVMSCGDQRVAERLHLGKPKGARTNLHKFMNDSQSQTPEIQLNIE